MCKRRKLRKYLTLFVLFAFAFQHNIFQYSQPEDEIAKQFAKAREKYLAGQFIDARNRLERVIAVIDEKGLGRKEILGKSYLLLGAICENEGEFSLAERNYRKAIDTYNATWVEGVDLEKFILYRQIVKGEKIQSRGIIEQAAKHVKKKKFPWLLAAAGMIVAGTAAVFLLKKKKTVDNSDYDTRVMGIEWIDIASGDFLMGDNFNDGFFEETPVHVVTLDTYSISKYEITFEQYDRYCALASKNLPDDSGWGRGTRPVINVSWEDATAFCQWLSEQTGKNIHLPTEAQWEKAARGSDQRKFPWGNSLPTCEMTNYNHCIGRTMPIGAFPADTSPYGVHDMGGNVCEWCSDWYDADYYSVSPLQNPTGPTTGSMRVYRGGAFESEYIYSRTMKRNPATPRRVEMSLGFRIALN